MRTPERQESGRYKVRFRHGVSPKTGHPQQASETFDTLAEARRFAYLLNALGPQGALDQVFAEARQAHSPSMDELAAEHIRHLTGIERGTRLTYERMWARAWSPHIGKLPANRLTRDDVARAVNVLAEKYAAKTIRNQHALLSAVCRRGVEEQHMRANPARSIRLPRSRESEAVEMRILTPAELDDIGERIHEHYRPFFWFLATTGCRWGEAVALTVADVSLPNVRIRRALKWSPDHNAQSVGAPKTHAGNRSVTLFRAYVADVAAACEGKRGTDLVWTAPKGGPVRHRTFWSDVWLPAVKHLSPRPRIHDLRHTHASILLGSGAPIHVVQARLGHEKIATTVDTYGHLLPDAQIAAAAAAEMAMGLVPRGELR